MDVSEKRMVGSLILLGGLTLLTMAVYTDQIAKVVELMSSIFQAAVAGLP